MSAPLLPIEGLSVSRAYISPEKPLLEASFLFLLGFIGFFWNGENYSVVAFPRYSSSRAEDHNRKGWL
jgi:hypothetical protein